VLVRERTQVFIGLLAPLGRQREVGVMTPPAKAGGFSGNGMSNLYRWRLKAPSEPLSQSQDIQRRILVTS
jgi:hypothetical protein